MRPMGWFDLSIFQYASGLPDASADRWTIGVSTVPQAIVLTRMWYLAYSTAIWRVISCSAPFDGPYAPCVGMPTSPEMEPLIRIRPPFWRIINGMMWRLAQYTAFTLELKTASHSSGVCS